MDKWAKYTKYQLQWMINHGHTLYELAAWLTDIINENPEIEDVTDALTRFEEEEGFDGELWASFEEFKNNELQEGEDESNED